MLENFCKAAGPRIELDQLIAEYPRKKALFRERIEAAEILHPETLDLLDSLAGYKLAVVSSSNRTEVEPSLVRFAIRERFDALVCGWEAPKLKPAPDPYLKAAELLGVSRALVVEDSAAGEQSGRAAGFDVVRIAHPAEVGARVRDAIAVLK
jgi:HAD superfamily hydrolase (TIGR01509 family)